MELIVVTKEELEKILRTIIEQNQPRKKQDHIYTNELISKSEVAEILDVSLSSVDNYRRLGNLKSYKFGNKVRFRRSEVLEAATSISASL